ncbi:hypothetical protein MFIFM68171_03390 [Madurella fahalii]|uniref:Uncharacterized protein n=1 Tax=Madurella fahalii TaxID=1157608 RepID=A0ABQ0G640_9PEZI
MDKSPVTASRAESWATCVSYQDEFYDVLEAEAHEGEPLPRARNNVWVSNQEKVRINFRRLHAGAEKAGLAKSPFFPKTAAEYAGLKADILEAEAAKLKAKIVAKEAALEDRRQGGQWKTIQVIGSSGKVETKTIPVYHSAHAPTAAPKVPDTLPRAAVDIGEKNFAVENSEARTAAEHSTADTVDFLLQLHDSQSPALDYAFAMHAMGGAATPADFNGSPMRQTLKHAGIPADGSWGRKAGLAFFDPRYRGLTVSPHPHPHNPRLALLREIAARAMTRKNRLHKAGSNTTTTNNPNPNLSVPGPVVPPPPRINPVPPAAEDGLSTVLALPNPFNLAAPADCEWPRPAEFHTEGDDRVKRWEVYPASAAAAAAASSSSSSSFRSAGSAPSQQHQHQRQHHSPEQPKKPSPYTELDLHMMDMGLDPVSEKGKAAFEAVMAGHEDAATQQQDSEAPRMITVGRFLPVPRLRDVADPRLELTAEEIAVLAEVEGGAAGQQQQQQITIPWRLRLMAGDRWDFHQERRLAERWAAANQQLQQRAWAGVGGGFDQREEEEIEEEEKRWRSMVKDLVEEEE